MFKEIAHIIFAFLLLTTTTGVVLAKHHCEKMPDSFHVRAISDDPCNHARKYCDIETMVIKVKSDFTKTTHTIDFDQIVIRSPESGNVFQENQPVRKPIYTISTCKLPKMQTVLARLQSYLL